VTGDRLTGEEAGKAPRPRGAKRKIAAFRLSRFSQRIKPPRPRGAKRKITAFRLSRFSVSLVPFLSCAG
jgi:hypothetical protein